MYNKKDLKKYNELREKVLTGNKEERRKAYMQFCKKFNKNPEDDIIDILNDDNGDCQSVVTRMDVRLNDFSKPTNK